MIKRHAGKLKSVLSGACLLAGLWAQLSCAPTSDNNPHWWGYTGDYRLNVKWPANDTSFEVFRLYKLPYTQGTPPDTFDWVDIDNTLDSICDRNSFIDSNRHDTIPVYFTKGYTGKLTIQAATANGRFYTSTDSVRVSVPYALRILPIAPESTSVWAQLVYTGDSTAPASIDVRWKFDTLPAPTTLVGQMARFVLSTDGDHQIIATLGDDHNNRLALPPATVRHPGLRPTLTFAARLDTTRITKTTMLHASVYDTSLIGTDSIHWDFRGDTLADTTTADTTLAFSSDSAGRHTIRAWVVNDLGISSRKDSMTVQVNENRPRMDSTYVKFLAASAGDTLQLIAPALRGDINVPVVRWNWSVAGPRNSVSTTETDTLKITFDTIGTYRIAVGCIDKDSIRSGPADSAKINVTITNGQPVVFGVDLDTVWIYDDTLYTMSANAVKQNGTVDSFFTRWDTSSVFAGGNSATTNHRISTAGWHTVDLYVKDNAGLFSDTISDTVFAKTGRPVFTFTRLDAADLFVFDTGRVRVGVTDSNGTIDSVKISWSGTTTFDSRGTPLNDTLSFGRIFSLADTSLQTLRLRAYDDDKLTRDTTIALQVLTGRPQLLRLAVDSVGDSTFVNDLLRLSVRARDPNGKIKRLYCTPDSAVGTIDSIVLPGSGRDSIDTFFTVRFDTTQAGPKTILAWSRDDDTLMSNDARKTINVRLAPPQIRGDSGDTLWVIIDNGAGRAYPVRVNHSDTNGAIIGYFWNEADATLGRRTTTDTIMRNFSTTEVRYPGFPTWVYSRDDDSLTRGGRFIVYADSAPPKPVLLNPALGDTSSLTIRWRNEDAKDSSETNFRLLIGYNSDPVTTMLHDFVAGTFYTRSGTEYRYTFHPTGPAFSIKVISRDARGSISEGDVQSFSY